MNADRLKFRVFDKDANMYETNYMNFYYAIGMSGKLFLCEDGGCDTKVDTDNYIVEQCTGLKDKNNNLIYTGDILKLKGDYAEEIAIVIDDVRGYCYDVVFNNSNKDNISLWYCVTCGDYEVEILGNIHESKDLIKQAGELK